MSEIIKIPPRQFLALKYYLMGWTAKEIAHDMGLTFATARDYLHGGKTKLGCSTRRELRIVFELCYNFKIIELLAFLPAEVTI